jgi:hypothetical protein
MANAQGNNGGRFYSFLNRPVLIDCNFIVDNSNGNGLGIRSLKGMGVRNAFMHTTASAGKNRGYTNPNPLAGYALLQLDSNYNRYCGGFYGFSSPLSGSNVAINSTALTLHQPYVISSVGTGPSGAATIAPVADVSGSLASTWFSLYDSYGNTFIIWFSVSGVGSAPIGVSGTLVQQSITTNETAANIGAALVLTIENLPQAPGSALLSFTATGTSTVTVTSTASRPLNGPPADGVIATGFTFALTVYNTNLACWQGVGLPLGVTPSVGAAFFATTTGVSTGGGSSGDVQTPSISGISSIEVVGDPSQTLAPGPMGNSPHPGGFVVVQFLAPTSSSTTTLTPTAPANNSVVGMSFYVEAGSILIDGE